MATVKFRSLLVTLFFTLSFVHLQSQQGYSSKDSSVLSFAQRVACQKAIEQVEWNHRIWPADNPQPKPALIEIISDQEIERKVDDYLRKGFALQSHWNKPIIPADLQAEINRMAQETTDPQMLQELWTALNMDPFLIAECLARPLLIERRSIGLDTFETTTNTLILNAKLSKDSSHSRFVLPSITNVEAKSAGLLADEAPSARSGHIAIWTGAEMIVWGGLDNQSKLSRTGGRYNPATNSWIATTLKGAPNARTGHTGVWTGSEMIVWGGALDGTGPVKLTKTGGKYNPASNSWRSTKTTGSPTARNGHTAVWTGTEMIVWGGRDEFLELNSGGRYNPTNNKWVPTNTTGAVERAQHTAVWTGTEMIVWGGFSNEGQTPGENGTGARYDAAGDSWIPMTTSGAPVKRQFHTAIWTGSEMIIWGGLEFIGTPFKTGGRYSPSNDLWQSTRTSGAPSGRSNHTAVWTGKQMIVWGGKDPLSNRLNTGGRYTPSSDKWVATKITGAPSKRGDHSAIWSGVEMIVWGGGSNTGGRYKPKGNSWKPTSL